MMVLLQAAVIANTLEGMVQRRVSPKQAAPQQLAPVTAPQQLAPVTATHSNKRKTPAGMFTCFGRMHLLCPSVCYISIPQPLSCTQPLYHNPSATTPRPQPLCHKPNATTCMPQPLLPQPLHHNLSLAHNHCARTPHLLPAGRHTQASIVS